MPSSQARIDANRRNSLRSTGPRTPEGRERSKGNALKHGLCSSVVLAEDPKLVRERAADFFKALKPQDPYQCWLVGEAALASVRIERCERMERGARDMAALKAESSWDEARRLDAARLGRALAAKPDVVVEELRQTFHGCQWMMDRWAMLAHSADEKGIWTPEQAQLAFDLLGTPLEFREGFKPGVAIDSRGRVVEAAPDPAALARREVEELEARRDRLEGLDETARALAEADLSDDDAELRRSRRYEAGLHRRMRWCLDQLRHPSPDQEPPPGLMTTWLARFEPPPEDMPPAPIPATGASTPVERSRDVRPPSNPPPGRMPSIGGAVDIPMIPSARREKKLKRAEARREAERRKLDKLRA